MIVTEKYFTDAELLQEMRRKNRNRHQDLLVERDVILRQIDMEVNSYFTDYLLFSLIRVQKKIAGRKSMVYKALSDIQTIVNKIH